MGNVEHSCHAEMLKEADPIYVTVYGKIGHNAACVDIAKRSIQFLKLY